MDLRAERILNGVEIVWIIHTEHYSDAALQTIRY
jgi:hypothetical protein